MPPVIVMIVPVMIVPAMIPNLVIHVICRSVFPLEGFRWPPDAVSVPRVPPLPTIPQRLSEGRAVVKQVHGSAVRTKKCVNAHGQAEPSVGRV